MFKFIDLFAGIGGFHLAMSSLGGRCVFASEIDKHSRLVYEDNFGTVSPELFSNGLYNDDIRNIIIDDLPDFDVLCAGFPCQSFSQIGLGRGFGDRSASDPGNLFFRLVEILRVKQPRAFFLENVRGILSHDNGRTFRIIQDTLELELGYSFHYSVIKASDYGLPQLRPRVFMIGFKGNNELKKAHTSKSSPSVSYAFPKKVPLKFNMSDVWDGHCSREIGFTLRVGGRGSNITDRRNWDAYLVNGKVAKLMPPQAARMQGFPKNFKFNVSNTQTMKQLGNSVAVDAVKACAIPMIKLL